MASSQCSRDRHRHERVLAILIRNSILHRPRNNGRRSCCQRSAGSPLFSSSQIAGGCWLGAGAIHTSPARATDAFRSSFSSSRSFTGQPILRHKIGRTSSTKMMDRRQNEATVPGPWFSMYQGSVRILGGYVSMIIKPNPLNKYACWPTQVRVGLG
jgi:hypothetical protein